MSAEATFWAWMMGVKPASAKLTLLCLADYHNTDTGRCDPSASTIAEFTGLDKKTVPAALDMLERAGLITIDQRRGTSPQYNLQIEKNPAPVRQKGQRILPVKKLPLPENGLPRNRVSTLPDNGDTPETGIPENGLPRKREPALPDNGWGGYPISGYKPTNNLQGTYQLPEPYGSAAVAAPPVDNFTLPDLGVIYSSVDPETEILNHGVPLLMRSGVELGKARNFLEMLIRDHKPGRTLDALIVTLIEQPVEPKSYLLAVLSKMGDEIPRDWVPPAPCLSELAAMGMPEKIYRDARDIFVTWFRELGIRHTNFPALFVRWCQRDWERAEANTALYLQRLRASAGFQETFVEPAGGTL